MYNTSFCSIELTKTRNTWSLTAVYYDMWYIAMYHMHCTECTTAGLRRCLTQLGLCPPLTSTLDQSSIIQSKTLHTALLDICHCTHAIFDQCLPLFGGVCCTAHYIAHLKLYWSSTIGGGTLSAISWPQAPACSCHWNKDGSVHV